MSRWQIHNADLPPAPAFNFATNMIAYYKLATNSNDSSVNGYNGTGTNMVYSGGYAQFAQGRYVDIPDNDAFSFTDGTNDLKAGFLVSFNYTDKTGIQFFLSKRNNTSNREWQVYSDGTSIYVRFMNLNSSPDGWIETGIPLTSISTTTLNTVFFQYSGNKAFSGLSAYLNGVLVAGTNGSSGTYNGQVNGNFLTKIGASSWNSNNPVKGGMKDTAIWKGRTFTDAEIVEIDYRVKNGISLI